jgi:hypothetical protein
MLKMDGATMSFIFIKLGSQHKNIDIVKPKRFSLLKVEGKMDAVDECVKGCICDRKTQEDGFVFIPN